MQDDFQDFETNTDVLQNMGSTQRADLAKAMVWVRQDG